MPVDKFGRNGDRTTPAYTRINIANFTNCFLRRDEDKNGIGAIDVNSNIIKSVSNTLSNQDVATKNYVYKSLLLLLALICMVIWN